MRKLIIIATAIALLVGCEIERSTRPMTLTNVNGSGWTRVSSTIRCDSVQMVSSKEAYVFIDGVKMKIAADIVYVHTNRGY